jgi:hypothetical protein
VLVGDLRTPGNGVSGDRHAVKYGDHTEQGVPGSYLIADAIVGLLQNRYLSLAQPLAAITFLVVLVVAAAACLIPQRLARATFLQHHRNRAALYVLLWVMAALAWLTMLRSTNRAVVHAGMIGLAVMLPLIGSFWVEFARNRYWYLDRTRGDALSCKLSGEGTVTMPSMPERSNPATRS